MTAQEAEEMQTLNPKTMQAFEEEKVEQQFLNGSAPLASATKRHH